MWVGLVAPESLKTHEFNGFASFWMGCGQAAGPRIIEKQWNSLDLYGFRGAWVGGFHQNH
jgi:hypothetical protein